jgi:D-xylose 1-dehydrogenase (NADP+, D-xylono-1,5-lactone-forming)
MHKVRWGILSTANIALTQVIPAIQRYEDSEVVAIASNSGKAQQAAEKLNISKFYDSYEALLGDSSIDAVYIPLPNHLHKHWVMEAAKHGKHILCEKPASLTAEETAEMIQYCRSHNVKFMEAFMYQFHPQHNRVKEILASGAIGEVKQMRASFSFYLDDRDTNIRMNKEMGGGSIYDVGCYCIHAIRNILESEPLSVQANALVDSQTGIDLTSAGSMIMENGTVASFDCSFDSTFRNEYEIIGTKGQIHVPRAFRPDVEGGEGLILIQNAEGERNEKVSGDIYRSEIAHISQSIMQDFDLSAFEENTTKNMQTIDACYQSIELGKRIDL